MAITGLAISMINSKMDHLIPLLRQYWGQRFFLKTGVFTEYYSWWFWKTGDTKGGNYLPFIEGWTTGNFINQSIPVAVNLPEPDALNFEQGLSGWETTFVGPPGKKLMGGGFYTELCGTLLNWTTFPFVETSTILGNLLGFRDTPGKLVAGWGLL